MSERDTQEIEPENLCPMFDTRNLITELIDDYWKYEDNARVQYDKLVFSQLVALICERTVVRAAKLAAWVVEKKLEDRHMSDIDRVILKDETETEVLRAIGFNRQQPNPT